MIKYRDSEIVQILPGYLKDSPEVQAISYAFRRQAEKLLGYMSDTGIRHNMDGLPEKILDYLAVELRTPAYSDNYPLEVKRELVAGTLPHCEKYGTTEAVEWLIRAIFGTGSIEEWQDYGGEPYHFRAYIGRKTDESSITPENIADFNATVAKVKRLTAWLDEIVAIVEMETAYVYPIPLFFETLTETILPHMGDPARTWKAAAYVAPLLGMNMACTALPPIGQNP